MPAVDIADVYSGQSSEGGGSYHGYVDTTLAKYSKGVVCYTGRSSTSL